MKGLSSRRSSCRLSSCRLSPYRRSTSSRPRLRRPTGSSPLLPRRPRHSHHHRQPAQQGRMRGRASAPTHKIFSGESSLTPNIDRMLAPLLTSRNTSLSHSSKTSTKPANRLHIVAPRIFVSRMSSPAAIYHWPLFAFVSPPFRWRVPGDFVHHPSPEPPRPCPLGLGPRALGAGVSGWRAPLFTDGDGEPAGGVRSFDRVGRRG